MTDQDRIQYLIQRHLDEMLSPEEAAELEAALRDDPAAARQFAQTARMDSALYAHFNECRAEETVRVEMARFAEAPAKRGLAPLFPFGRRAPFSWRALGEHLWGPSGAVILHLVLLALLLRFTVAELRKPTQEYEVSYATDEKLNLDDLLPPPDDIPSEVPTVAPPTDLGSAAAPQELPDDTLASPPDAGPEGFDVAASTGPLVLHDLRYGTRSGSGRADALQRYNPVYAAETEKAVIKALEWLKRKQSRDGSWGPNKVAMTGLALLTFLAHGETTSSADYGETITRALQYLVSQQDAAGRFAPAGGGTGGDPTTYAHAIATYALCEAYGLLRIPALKPVMEKAVQVILDGQQTKGGWDYRFSKTARRDTSVSGWMVQALKSAYIAGAANTNLQEAMSWAAFDLKSVYRQDTGRFGYTERGSGSLGCTGIGVLCLQLLGQGAEPEARGGLQALKDATVDWQKDRRDGWPLYEWYYITQAKFHHGAGWERWNNQFARAYIEKQNEDGSWPPASSNEAGHGPVYATTFAALTLQVYYRFLPTYQSAAVKPSSPENTNDVSVRVL